MNLHSMRPRAALAALALVVAGCAEGTSEPQRPPVVTIVNSSARVGNMVSAYVSGARITEQQIPATINGVALTLIRQNDSTLTGLVPDMPSGNYTMMFAVNGVQTGASLLIVPPPYVENPVVTVNAVLDSALAEFSFTPPDGVTADQWATHRDQLDSLVTEARTLLASATPAEQLAAARLLVSTREAGAFMSASMASVTFECANAIGKASLSVITAAAALGVTVGGIVVPGAVFLAPIGGVLMYLSMPHVLADVPNAFSVCSTRETVDFTSETPSSLQSLTSGASLQATGTPMAHVNDDLLFRLGQPIMITVTEKVRALSREDMQERQVAEFAAAVDNLYSVVSQLPAKVAKLLPPLPPRLPATSQVVTTTVPTSKVRVGAISTTAVTLTATQSNGKVAIRASSQLFGDIPFQFSIFNTDNQNGARRVNAILRVGDDSTAFYGAAIQGSWTVSLLSGSGETYQMTVLPNGLAEYSANGQTYRAKWSIVRGASGRYYMYDEDFWHPAFWYLLRDPLVSPVTGFTTYNDDGTPAVRYTRN